MNHFKKESAVLLALVLAGCSASTSESTKVSSTNASYTPGTYEGSAEGRFGQISVSVTLDKDKIESIEVTENNDSAGVSDLPVERIPKEIVEYQSLNVDSISGATLTSAGIKNAVKNAIESSGASTDALENKEVVYPDMSTDDVTTQVAVVGSGMAGLVAAATAAEKGADVTLIEKLPYVGGTLMMAGGYMVTVDSDTDDPALDDSLKRVDSYYKQVNADSVRPVDYDFFDKLVSKTGSAIDYLKTNMGIDTETNDAGNVIMTHAVNNGAGLVKQLDAYLKDHDVNILTDTTAEEIVMEDGKASGVKVKNRTGEYTVHADKVIMAAGGATWDLDDLKEKNPEMDTIDLYQESVIGDDGSGYKMLETAGAKMGDGPYIKSEVPNFPIAFKRDWKTTPFPSDKLLVNAEGKRFANENPLLNYMLNTYLLREASPAYYAIYDTAHTSDAELMAQIKELSEDDNSKVAVHADTIEDLAKKLNMDPDTLKNTYDTYQAACDSGVDSEFGKDADHLVKYDDSDGLYAVYIMPASLGTIGGALTDDNMHVLGQNNQPIENLYAVGECATSTLFGDYYVGSFSLGMYTAAGKTAAETAVQEINQ